MVPWVAGWDGPICNSIVSAGSSFTSAFIISVFTTQSFFQAHQLVVRPFVDERAFNFAFWNSGLNEIDRIVFPERMTAKFFVQENSAQIRMLDEANTEKIPDFALHEVRTAPHRRQRLDGWIVLRHRNTDSQLGAVGARLDLIDDFEAWFLSLPIIHRRDVRE